jgi:hypothetical protein
MTNYLQAHKKNFLSESTVNKSDLAPGAIIQFTYLDEDKQMTKPVVVVLNPVYHGNLHAIRIDEIQPIRVQRLVEEIKLWYNRRLNEKVNTRLPLVKVNVGTPRSFYENKLKLLIPKLLKSEDCYREYKLNRISALRVIEYRFDVKEREDAAIAAKKLKEKKLMEDAIRRVRAGAQARRV